jgi:crossover junction endodeoxyribonuclease RusA
VTATLFTRNRDTGIRAWTRKLSGGLYAVAELRQFGSGDLFWMVGNGVAWGDTCVIGTWPEFDLPRHWQEGLPQSKYPTPTGRQRPLATRLELPYPVSSNRYWRHVPNKRSGRTMHFLSEEAKAYKTAVAWIAKAAGFRQPTQKAIDIKRITLVPRTHNEDGVRIGARMDLTNCWKVAEDALQEIVYMNDRQIQHIGDIGYGEPTRDGALIIEIAEFEYAPTPLFEEMEEA